MIQRLALRFSKWVGTPASLIVHTLIFLAFPGLIFLGVDSKDVLLVLTTGLSLEAIYLTIFLQMSVNHKFNQVSEGIEDIQEVIEEEFEISEDEA